MANDHSQRGIATLLSILIGGFGGQFYNGQVMKGMVILGLQAINYVMFFFLIGFVTMPLVWRVGRVSVCQKSGTATIRWQSTRFLRRSGTPVCGRGGIGGIGVVRHNRGACRCTCGTR
jgi:hypothetical protein